MNYGWLGAAVAGFINGSFAVPSKRMRVMRWDQAWMIFCFVALLLMPLLLTLVFAPAVLTQVLPEHPRRVLQVMAFGMLWGTGAFLFAASIPRLGIALTDSLVTGMVALIGSCTPMLVGSASINRQDVPFLVVGLALMLVGIALCCRASILRDRRVDARPDVPVDAGKRSTPIIGVLIALLSGVLSAMLNTGFAYGEPLMESAVAAGVREDAKTLAVWVPALWGGLLVNVIGTAFKIHRHHGWSNFRASGAGDYTRAIVMGVLWLLAILIYGISSTVLGSGGTVYGYAVVNCVSILAATVWGLKTGEWAGASTAARTWLYVGTAALIAAFVILTRSGGA